MLEKALCLSPAVGHLVARHRLAPSAVALIQGSGPRGRILKGDVLAFLAGGSTSTSSGAQYAEAELGLAAASAHLARLRQDTKRPIPVDNLLLKAISAAAKRSGFGTKTAYAMHSPVGLVAPLVALDSVKVADVGREIQKASNRFLEKQTSDPSTVGIYNLNTVDADVSRLSGTRVVILPHEHTPTPDARALAALEDALYNARGGSAVPRWAAHERGNSVDLFESASGKRDESGQPRVVRIEAYGAGADRFVAALRDVVGGPKAL